MLDWIRIALRYLIFHWIKTCILALAIALTLFLPVALNLLVQQGSASLLIRAEATPLVIGSKASPLELALNTLYFNSKQPPPITYGELERVQATDLADAIPIYSRFSAQGFPIIGTNSDYLASRELRLAKGRNATVIGECILGAGVARKLGLSVGDAVFSTPEEVFDLAGVYPLKMKVVGILEATATPDDHIILTDIKTTWIIAGYAHGHADLSQANLDDQVLSKEDAHIVASPAILTYNEITDSNRSSYHFHGEISDMPLTSVIALPHDEKSSALLQGKYLGEHETVQLILPSKVISELLETVFTIRNYLMLGAALAIVAMLAIAALVFMLSIRLRKREIETMHRIGISRASVTGTLGIEIGIVFLLGFAVASLLAYAFSSYMDVLLRNIVNAI